MARVNLTVKSRDRMKAEGMTVETVERWNHFAGIRQDLFGIIDILGVGGGRTLAVQTTSRDNMSSRRKKIMESAIFPELVKCGWCIELHGWYKEKNRWQVQVEVLHEPRH